MSFRITVSKKIGHALFRRDNLKIESYESIHHYFFSFQRICDTFNMKGKYERFVQRCAPKAAAFILQRGGPCSWRPNQVGRTFCPIPEASKLPIYCTRWVSAALRLYRYIDTVRSQNGPVGDIDYKLCGCLLRLSCRITHDAVLYPYCV